MDKKNEKTTSPDKKSSDVIQQSSSSSNRLRDHSTRRRIRSDDTFSRVTKSSRKSRKRHGLIYSLLKEEEIVTSTDLITESIKN